MYLYVYSYRNNFVFILSHSSILIEAVDPVSRQSFIAETLPGLPLVVDNTGRSGPAQVDLGAVEPVPVTLPVLHCTKLNQNWSSVEM